MIVTSKYALIGKNNQPQPTLKKLNFETMKLETIVYEPIGDWVNIYPINLADLKNGDIAFGVGYYVFILNN
jgi:ABC-type siderophore export system fused ATPase/permease subunit